MVQTGRYKHYKGNEYEVIGVAIQTETLEELVIYKSLTQDTYHKKQYPVGSIWARPAKIFFEEVEYNGKKVPRFELIAPVHEAG